MGDAALRIRRICRKLHPMPHVGHLIIAHTYVCSMLLLALVVAASAAAASSSSSSVVLVVLSLSTAWSTCHTNFMGYPQSPTLACPALPCPGLSWPLLAPFVSGQLSSVAWKGELCREWGESSVLELVHALCGIVQVVVAAVVAVVVAEKRHN